MTSIPVMPDGLTTEEQTISAEASSAVLEQDLQRMRHDRREFIKANRRVLAKLPKFGETFGQVQSTDMPPQFRAILEDNRMLHEQIRNYKKELYETHASNTVHEKHIVRLQSEIKRLHEAFQECGRSPSQISSEREAAGLMRQQEEEVQKLRDQVSVLAHAKETDARRLRHIATERHRERQDLKGEVDSLKAQVVEKDKAFRAQAFTLKQANMRLQQVQQQQHEAEQAHHREAALLEEELAHWRTEDAGASAESISGLQNDLGFVFGQGTMRAGGLSPTLRRRPSQPARSLSIAAGTAMRMSSLASTLASQVEESPEAPQETVKIMLVMLRSDAVEGFYQQAHRQAVLNRRHSRDAEEAAILIQSGWRMKQAKMTLSRLKQQQEAQQQAAAQQQAEEERRAVSPRLRQGSTMRGTVRRTMTKLKGFGSQGDIPVPKSPQRGKSTRSSDQTRSGAVASPKSRSPVGGSTDSKGPSRQQSSVRL